jgi:hypothetical protein
MLGSDGWIWPEQGSPGQSWVHDPAVPQSYAVIAVSLQQLSSILGMRAEELKSLAP